MANPWDLRNCPNCHKSVKPVSEPRTGGAEVPKPISIREKFYCPECGHVFTGKKYNFTKN